VFPDPDLRRRLHAELAALLPALVLALPVGGGLLVAWALLGRPR
jgi:hypothetical protein